MFSDKVLLVPCHFRQVLEGESSRTASTGLSPSNQSRKRGSKWHRFSANRKKKDSPSLRLFSTRFRGPHKLEAAFASCDYHHGPLGRIKIGCCCPWAWASSSGCGRLLSCVVPSMYASIRFCMVRLCSAGTSKSMLRACGSGGS